MPGARLSKGQRFASRCLLDPKIYDDGAYEAAKYAERRDDIGRLMLSVMVQARGGIAAGGAAGR